MGEDTNNIKVPGYEIKISENLELTWQDGFAEGYSKGWSECWEFIYNKFEKKEDPAP